jgi:hypothetical protein
MAELDDLDRLSIKHNILPELGGYDMACKFCKFRFVDEDSEFHKEQGDSYRGQGCGKFGEKPKPVEVMHGQECRLFSADREAELKYPLWEQMTLTKAAIEMENWEILESGINAELEKLWEAWEKEYGWRWAYLGETSAETGKELTYEYYKAEAEREESG